MLRGVLFLEDIVVLCMKIGAVLEDLRLCLKIGAVLESADNSVRKDKGRYFYEMLALSRIKVCLNL
jgi:hypothetical protein